MRIPFRKIFSSMPKDEQNNTVPIIRMDTAHAFILNGSVSAALQVTAFAHDQAVELDAYSGDCWWQIGAPPTTAVSETGNHIAEGQTKWVHVLEGEKISVIGGKLNVTQAK